MSAEQEEKEELRRIADALADIRRLLQERFAPPHPAQLDEGDCWRWEATENGGRLTPIQTSAGVGATLKNLLGLEEPIRLLSDNTRRFLAGEDANHALLTGPRGCGKSSVARGVFGKYRRRGLRLIETDIDGMAALPALRRLLAERREKYILYCDDLSFNDNDPRFNKIKTAIDGAVHEDANMLIYATSNRRNIIAEKFVDNLATAANDGGDDIQPSDAVNEKIALSDRFGLWLPFRLASRDDYEAMVRHWLTLTGVAVTPALLAESVRFADYRGSHNGRIARQFAINAAGKAKAGGKAKARGKKHL